MREFLDYLIVSYNVWFTAPLTIVFLLALFRLAMGAMDFGDTDVDTDIDADIDVDADADMDADTGLQNSSFSDVFGFLNVGRVPLASCSDVAICDMGYCWTDCECDA